jgi:hypothetical protein
MAKKEMCENHSKKCMATTLIILGILIVLKDLYWKNLSWAVFIGGLIILKGLMKILHPACKK